MWARLIDGGRSLRWPQDTFTKLQQFGSLRCCSHTDLLNANWVAFADLTGLFMRNPSRSPAAWPVQGSCVASLTKQRLQNVPV